MRGFPAEPCHEPLTSLTLLFPETPSVQTDQLHPCGDRDPPTAKRPFPSYFEDSRVRCSQPPAATAVSAPPSRRRTPDGEALPPRRPGKNRPGTPGAGLPLP